MRNLFIISLVLSCIASLKASAETVDEKHLYDWIGQNLDKITVEMSCQITDQLVLEVKEGKPRRYLGYDEDPKVGDTLVLKFWSWADKIKFQLGNEQEEYIDSVLDAEKGEKQAKGVHFFSDPMHNRFHVTRMKIFSDAIGYVHHNVLGGKTFNLYRYYKSDWHGIFTGLYGPQTHILTMDCRTIVEGVDETIARYKTYPGEIRNAKTE